MVFYGFNISQKVLSSDWPLCFNIKNHELNCEEEMKYLGVVLDETLIYKQHINQLNKKTLDAHERNVSPYNIFQSKDFS